ncbi:MAG: hypothetical protein NC340_04155 [Ruminococcus flavefaciens]|nr:hypothetical protein [Ruminococcus flavefaciens]MCM1229245.1 hypothetical protein [Ruminococcus flavefaciens]
MFRADSVDGECDSPDDSARESPKSVNRKPFFRADSVDGECDSPDDSAKRVAENP